MLSLYLVQQQVEQQGIDKDLIQNIISPKHLITYDMYSSNSHVLAFSSASIPLPMSISIDKKFVYGLIELFYLTIAKLRIDNILPSPTIRAAANSPSTFLCRTFFIEYAADADVALELRPTMSRSCRGRQCCIRAADVVVSQMPRLLLLYWSRGR